MAIFKVLAFAASCVALVAAFPSPPELDEFNGLNISTGINTQLEGIFKLPRKLQKQQIQNLFLHQQEQWNKKMEKAQEQRNKQMEKAQEQWNQQMEIAQEQIDKLVNQTNFLSGELRSVTDEKESYRKEVSLITTLAMIEKLEGKFAHRFHQAVTLEKEDIYREKLWEYMFKDHRNEREIKFILEAIHQTNSETDGTIEKVVAHKIAETANILERIEKNYIRNNIKPTVYHYIKQKIKYILVRDLDMPLIFRDDVPAVVRETATLLSNAYMLSLEDTLLNY